MTRNVYIGKSSIDGKGVFAKKDFKRGDIVFILKGKLVKWIVKDKKTSQAGPNWVGVGHNLWIDPDLPFDYLNHSCDPNMGIKGRVTFVALKNIRKGEELTFDYSITEEDMLFEMKNLQKKGVRHRSVIRSIQYLPLATYKKYLPYVPKFFQKVYTTYHKLKSNG